MEVDSSESDKSSSPSPPLAEEHTLQETRWQPPPEFKLQKYSRDVSQFDLHSINSDDNLELWAIRAPTSLKFQHVKRITSIDYDNPRLTGRLNTSKAKYNVVQIRKPGKDQIQQKPDGNASEMANLKVLLPTSDSEGQYRICKKPISRHLLIQQSFTTATAPSDDIDTELLAEPEIRRATMQPFSFTLYDRASSRGSISSQQQLMDLDPIADNPKKKRKTEKG